MKSILCAVALVAMAGPAFAGDTHGKTQCGWQRGVYVCQSTYESDYAKTTQTCATGDYGTGGCSTITKEKPQPQPVQPEPPPKSEFVPHDPGAYQRAKAREAENIKNGWTSGVVVCTTDHWAKDHWEPTCRWIP